MGYIDRVADRATGIKLLAILLSAVAGIFYLIGFAVALAFVALRWCVAAFLVAWSDATGRFAPGGDI